MKKYVYENLKGVVLHGMKPGEIKEFDHEILGGGIRLVEMIDDSKKKKSNKKMMVKEDLSQEMI